MKYCPQCGAKLEEAMKFCSNCGQKLVDVGKEPEEEEKQVESRDLRSSALVIERAEPTYYSDENGVRITPTRLIIPGKTGNEGPSTYAMANITSIKIEKRDPNRWGGIITALIGLILIVAGAGFNSIGVILFGVVLLGAGIAWAVLLKPTYHLRVSSASGETDALNSKDKQYVDHVVTALNEALIKRG